MKAQAQAAPIIQKPVHDPLPPVIVKIGGGVEPPNGVLINIGSRIGSRIDPTVIHWTVIERTDKTAITWTKSQTTLNGRIHGLTVQDLTGSEPVLCRINPQLDVLTTMNLCFASDQDTFEVSEVLGEDGSIHMEADSTGSFEAEDPMPDGRWTRSGATFLSRLVKVEFRQRKIDSDVDFIRFEYLVNSAVEVSVDYQAS